MRGTGIWLVLLFLPFLVAASPQRVALEYAGFYDRLERAAEPQYSLIRIAFFVTDSNQQPCILDNAYMQDRDKRQYPLEIADSGELNLPFSQELDEKKARLIFFTNKEDCVLSFKVLAKETQRRYSSEQVQLLYTQMSELLSDLGGPLSFLMPDTIGLRFHFDQANVSATGADCTDIQCDWLAKSDTTEVVFTATPTFITPLMSTN